MSQDSLKGPTLEPPTTSILRFDLAGGRYGLRAEVVREITRAVATAPLPRAPAIVEGVINARGTLVPVLDIRQRFGHPPQPLAPEQHLIIALAGGRVVCLRVDRARDLIAVETGAIESAERIIPGIEHVAGIARLADGLIVIHDLDSFLSLEEAGQVDAALAGATAPGAPGGSTR